MPSSNRKQCFVIEGAEVLANPNGTAPGLWIEDGLRRLVLLPGPPRELEPMFDNSVRPKLAGPDAGFTVRRVLRVTGLPESRMEDKLKSVYPRLPPGIGVTTLAYPGDMQIRLTVRGVGDSTKAGRELACAVKLVCGRLGEHVYSAGGEALEEVVGGLLKRRNASVACAESCTGGLLGHRLTNVPGSSAYFLEGVIAYSDRAKIRRLGVLSAQIRVHGAVSAQVAEAMARGIRTRAGADFGLAVTGVAGPGGGSAEKPVGLVFTALAWEGGVSVERNIFPGSREIVKSQSAQKALDMLRRRLLLEIRETA
jgi:nicotinamide-nucleotide amidase